MNGLRKPCAQCPWRLENQGKRHFGSFYSKVNLRRLWNQVRGGGGQQSCHLTDPSHPDHLLAGAKATAVAQECPGSVILVLRELRIIEKAGEGVISPAAIDRYLANRKHGITKRGMLYWIVQRIQLAGAPILGAAPIPDIPDDEAVGLPEELRS